jgi:hypothetical protein
MVNNKKLEYLLEGEQMNQAFNNGSDPIRLTQCVKGAG